MTTSVPTVAENVSALLSAHAELPSVELSSHSAENLTADVLVVATADDDGTVVVRESELSPRARTAITEALALVDAGSAPDTVVRIPAPEGISATTVLATGTGKLNPALTGDEPVDGPDAPEVLRRAAAAATRALAGTESAVLALPAATDEELGAVVHGALVGAYAFTRYKDAGKAPVGALTVVTSRASDAAEQVARRAEILAHAVVATRDFVNTTPVHLTPEIFAEAAAELATGVGVEVEILDDTQLREGGYGAISGVGQGSMHPPRMVRLSWRGESAGSEVAFVGKGITFDSGGLSLKPGKGMETMKCDMAGAAAVLHTVLAAAKLRLPITVHGWLALAENMPSGTAQRPADVVTARDGTTIEVLNTDAEGRLAMADAMVAAREHSGDSLDMLLDVATLTGAQVVALGNHISGVMGTKDVRQKVLDAANRAGEAMWPAALPKNIRKNIDSPIADLINTGGREGGMLAAGCFMQHFAAEVPWAHIDIAGPAFHEGGPTGTLSKGGTGVAVATLLAFLEDAAAQQAGVSR